MPGMSFPVHVAMDDGTEHDVVIEQRDIAAWEREPFGCSFSLVMQKSEVNFYRYAAWHALRRIGEIDKRTGWASFDDACKEVVDRVEPIEIADPTEPDTSGETSSN